MSLDPRTDPPRDEDARLLGPDSDRNDGAMERLLARVLGDRAYANRRSHGGTGRYRAMPGRKPTEVLSDRQREVLTCASHGLGRIETADALGIDPDTVASHRAMARRLLGAKTLEHAVALAIRRGLIR